MNDILMDPNPLLHKRASEVTLPLSDSDFSTLQSMLEYLHNSQDDVISEQYHLRPAVGLAAPQIGVMKRMFVMSTYNEKGDALHEYVVVNPKILSASEEQTYLPGGEGCLSVDEEENGLVPRAKRIKVKFMEINLSTREATERLLKLQDYVGIVFQHEFDHLNGVLFTSKVKDALPTIKPVVFYSPDAE
jgi:peptide deformylase